MDDNQELRMESSIRAIAESLRPKVVSGPPRDNVSVIPTAGVVSKRLEGLIERARDLEKQAHILAGALAGGHALGHAPGENPVPGAQKTPDHLFGKQMAALDELGQILDSVGRQIERAQRSLA